MANAKQKALEIRKGGTSAMQARGDIKTLHHFKHTKNLPVKHESEGMRFVKSTSSNGNHKDTKVSFKESGAYHKKMMEGLSSAGYQAHRAAKDKQRGIH